MECFFQRRNRLLLLLSTLALLSAACSNDKIASLSNQTVNAPVPAPPDSSTQKQPTLTKHSAVLAQQQKDSSATSDTYQQAIDTATGAITVSQSAVGRNDWSLVANQWQKAINLLKAVPSGSTHYKTAQKKLIEYKRYLAEAQLRGTPVSAKPCSGDTNPAFFSVPIKGRLGGTPIVEVTFNDKKFDMLFDTGASHTLITLSMAASLNLPLAGLEKAKIASGSVVILPVALVKSQEIDGRFRMKVPVAVAPGAAFGLLGQDFYKGYDIAIKENVIEFRRQSYSSVAQRKTACLVDTNPQSFSVPIINRKHNIPVVEVTFNDKYTFPMLFDTGASNTVITRRMAAKMGLKFVGWEPMEVADGSVAAFAIAPVKSQRVASRIKRDMEVAVAPSADVGLLGQDFFEGYSYTIRDSVIEFHRNEEPR